MSEPASPSSPILFASYTLAIVTLKASAWKAHTSHDAEMQAACEDEIQRLELRRLELLEKLETRIGGS